MGVPRKHIPVKIIAGLISQKPHYIIAAGRILEKKFGKIDCDSPLLDFSCTTYYDEEFGKNLKRKLFSFRNLAPLTKNCEIKLYTNKIERKLSGNNKKARAVNIDPGYITLAKLVLFTTKNRSHRVYLGRGIFADLELMFANKTFHPLEWTYPDYRTKEYIDFFNSVRTTYVAQIKSYGY